LNQHHHHLQESRRMLGNQKGLSAVGLFAVVTLLSYCSPASSFAFLPRVSRTNDAVIIDFAGVGYAPSYYGKTLYGQIVNPAFVPLPSVYGWSFPLGYPSLISPSNRQFDSEYEEYLGHLLTAKQAPKCGSGPVTMPTSRALATERVAGGIDAKKGAWPFLVALRNSAGGVFCSGTLLTDSKVLLAAQCLEKLSLFELSGVTVLAGMFLSDQSDVQMTRRISKVVLHSRYNAFTFANDIAIITLDAPVVLSRSVATACLPAASADPDQFVDIDAVVLGWGSTGSGSGSSTGSGSGSSTGSGSGSTIGSGSGSSTGSGSGSSTGSGSGSTIGSGTGTATNLKQAKVSILANADCKSDATVGKYVSDNTTCIYSASGTVYTCVIDVGGPVVTLPAPGTWTVVGINSYTAAGCASNGLKTRVAAFRTWIDTYMV